MRNILATASKLFLVSGLLLLLVNCSKEKDSPLEQDQTVSAVEVRTILNTDDLSSSVDKVITDIFQNSPSGKSVKQNDCYVTEYSNTGYTVTFDNCSFEGSENVSGTLSVIYVEGAETTAFTATYTDIMVGAIKINGTRAFTLTGTAEGNSVNFSIVTDMSITLEDGTVIQEMGTKAFAYEIDITNIQNSAISISGDWTVKIDDDTYVVNITSPLKANLFGCDYIGEGILSIAKNGLAVSVDFGDGTCDDLANLTYPDGTVKEISLKDN